MELSELEKKLLYVFKSRDLLDEARRHSSFVNEQPGTGGRDNERLEFLGDAVLNLSVGHLLMRHYPDSPEGDLSRMRANLVNESQLAEVARELNLGSYLLLGRGEQQSNGQEKPSILADAFEAIVAAIYLDAGFDRAFKFVRDLFQDRIASGKGIMLTCDYKSRLQEMVQGTHKEIPVYRVTGEIGPDHDKTFIVEIETAGFKAEGRGKSKKNAEQDAARAALDILEKQRE
jgi:ribonuclease III